ncbi:hypothetical protein, partial [Stenotrophomonas maltophilia]|uniref:hypothetical protein n=1 Tax=Stenotrophomonas maltophilia TaxID=40324 RepID=UPI00209A7053
SPTDTETTPISSSKSVQPSPDLGEEPFFAGHGVPTKVGTFQSAVELGSTLHGTINPPPCPTP